MTVKGRGFKSVGSSYLLYSLESVGFIVQLGCFLFAKKKCYEKVFCATLSVNRCFLCASHAYGEV